MRAPVLGVTACVCAFVFTGWIPPLGVLARIVPFGLVAAALITALYLWIGLLAFWLEDVSPVYWVSQKALFVLGGLMLPIELYPDFIRRAAAFTPFPSVLAGPASFVLPGSSRGIRRPCPQPRDLGRCDGAGGVVGVSARDIGADGQRGVASA